MSEIQQADGDDLPPMVRQSGFVSQPAVRISYDRYMSQAIADHEMDLIWRKTRQVACREEDIPDVGDRIRYEVANLSFLVVRTASDEIRAFYNNCRHRGRTLCEGKGSGYEIRCSFHARTWNLDGSLDWVPGAEDFPHVGAAGYALKTVQVARWEAMCS